SDIVASVEHRLARLRHRLAGDAGDDDVQRMSRWVDDVLAPVVSEVGQWCRGAARQAGIAFDEPIVVDARTLSPSDFGFHNAIRSRFNWTIDRKRCGARSSARSQRGSAVTSAPPSR